MAMRIFIQILRSFGYMLYISEALWHQARISILLNKIGQSKMETCNAENQKMMRTVLKSSNPLKMTLASRMARSV